MTNSLHSGDGKGAKSPYWVIQAILFDKSMWTTREARAWLKKNGHEPIKRVHKTKNYLRYRLEEPIWHSSHSEDVKGAKSPYRIKKIGTNGIKFVFMNKGT